ncbi:MAG TPA: hypothetical protein PKW82_06665 [Spirochaetales bacterium]|nr:hypothetical protein [Spirochaetales bacterium]
MEPRTRTIRSRAAGVAAFVALAALGACRSAPAALPGSAALPWKGSLNIEQTGNSCGPHSAMAAIFVATGATLDPREIDRTIGSRMANGYTWPWGVARFLRANGVTAKIRWHALQPDSDRLTWVRARIADGHPVIVIVGTRRYLHYVTVLGYSGERFSLYDSLKGADLNGAAPGNLDLSATELLAWWKGAVWKGIPINLSIGG